MKGIIQRSAGSWRIMYDLPPGPDGKRRQVRETIRGTKKQAEQYRIKRLNEVLEGTHAERGKMPFNELADRFLASRKLNVTATTYALYDRYLRHHVRPVLGHMKIGTIKKEHVENVLTSATDHTKRKKNKGKPLSGTTLRNVLVITKAVLQYAVDSDWLSRNVGNRVGTPKSESEREPVVFKPEDAQRLISGLIGTELSAVVPFAIGTGARRGEIAALKWCDLDLDANTITIRRSAANVGREVVYKAPKSKKSQRSDVLPPFVVDLLKEHRRSQKKRRGNLGLGRPDDDGFVFTRADGTPWDPNELSRQFSRLIRRRKLRAVRFHDLRHAHASLAYAAGVPLKTISESLGHSSIGITSSIYVHLLHEGRQEKADRLDAYMRKAVGSR